jgi:hypothetical protein
MTKTFKTRTGARDPSGRDLVFEAWFEDNIENVEGGALEQRSIYKAYRQAHRGDRALGEQGVERMLNTLGVTRSVRQGKPYRLGIGFKVDIVAGRPDDAKGEALTRALTAGDPWPKAAPEGAKATPRRTAMEPDEIEVEPPRPAGALQMAATPMLRVANLPDGPDSMVFGIPCDPGGTIHTALALHDVLSERLRQRAAIADGGEGFDAAHDDASDPGAHERAAACYAYAAAQPDRLAPFVETSAKQPREGRLGWIVRETIILMWPWATQWWKPHTEAPDWKRRCMVKAAALLLAAIERHDREAARQALADSQRDLMTGV